MVRAQPLVLENVPRDRIEVSTFWYLLLRPLAVPHKQHSMARFYGSLLPFLTEQPIESVPDSEFTEYYPCHGGSAVDRSGAKACLVAIGFSLRAMGSGRMQALFFSQVSMRMELIHLMIEHSGNKMLSAPDAAFLRVACPAVARTATMMILEEPSAQGFLTDTLQTVENAMEVATKQVAPPISAAAQITEPTPKPLPSPMSSPEADLSIQFPGLDVGMLRQETVAQLAGQAPPPKVVVPPELTSVQPQVIDSWDDLTQLLGTADKACLLLLNQQSDIHNAQQLVFWLIPHLLSRIIPLPVSDSRACWYRQHQESLTLPTQEYVVNHITRLAKHFTAACLSLGASGADSGARAVSALALCAVLDAVVRTQPGGVHGKNLLSDHWSAKSSGLTDPFCLVSGTDTCGVSEQSNRVKLVTPALSLARSQVLEYFRGMNTQGARAVFSFEESMSPNVLRDGALLSQLSLALGLGRFADNHALAEAVADDEKGNPSQLFACLPALQSVRDVAFLCKVILLSPERHKLPKHGHGHEPFTMNQINVTFRAQDPKDGAGLVVHGAGKSHLEQFAAFANKPQGNVFEKIKGGLFSSVTKKDRAAMLATLSAADPSLLVGEEVKTEEDILFLDNKKMPRFDRLSTGDVERLLTILLAPMLRLPLVVGFLSQDTDKIMCLCDERLQATLDACLFEPGGWRSHQKENSRDVKGSSKKAGPRQIPDMANPHILGTGAGLLMNELVFAPDGVLSGILTLLRSAIDKDSGKDTTKSARLMYYMVRLGVRLHQYVHAALWHPDVVRVISGVEVGDGLFDEAKLSDYLGQIKKLLTGPYQRTMSGWAKTATANRRFPAACAAHAHLALLSLVQASAAPQSAGNQTDGWVEDSDLLNLFDGKIYQERVQQGMASDRGGYEFTQAIAKQFLGAQVFLGIHYKWKRPGEATDPKLLGGITESELLQCFTEMRSPLFDYLQDEERARSEVFEHALNIAQGGTGSHKKKNMAGDMSPSKGDRNWLESPYNPGTFYPDTNQDIKDEDDDLPVEQEDKGVFGQLRSLFKRKEGPQVAPSVTEFESWLKRTLAPQALAVDVSTGRIISTQSNMSLLPEWARTDPEVRRLFGYVGGDGQGEEPKGAPLTRKDQVAVERALQSLLCAEEEKTVKRHWVALVGLRHSILRWTPDYTRASSSCNPAKRRGRFRF